MDKSFYFPENNVILYLFSYIKADVIGLFEPIE